MLVLILTSACIILVYRYITRNHDYWAKRNVKHDPPLPLFGNHLKNVLVMRTTPGIGTEMLNKYKGEKLVGYFRGTTPVLIIKDPEIVKRILTIDFKSFSDRGWNDNMRKQPLSQNLMFAKPELWRTIKQQLTPGFTLHKLRTMMAPRILQCVGKLEKTIEEIVSSKETVTAYDLLVGYTLRSIGACGFSIEITEQSLFANLMKKFFVKSTTQIFFQGLLETFPGISVLGNYVKVMDEDLEEIIMEMTRNLIDIRKVNPSLDKDFLDIFLDTATKRNDDNFAKLSADKKEKADLQFIAAQLFFFVFAGFETTAMSMSTTLHQLAYHPEIQSEVQKEIDSVLSKHDNKLMECLDDMPLLDMVFKETMRLWAPFGALRRVCAEKYTIPDTDISIDPGVGILIPIQAIHNDPEFYDNPEEFRPQRFATKRSEYTYLAFGHGPKKCIGYKLGTMMVLAGLAAILHRFTVVPGEGSDPRIKFKKTSFLAQIVEGGVPVKFILRK